MDQKTKEKLLSGRLWLVLITGIVFAYATYAKILSGEAVSAIIVAVYSAYFGRTDRNGNTDMGKAQSPKVSP